MNRDITDEEFKIIEEVRKLQPYGIIELAMNQDGSIISMTRRQEMRPIRTIIRATLLLHDKA